MKILLAAPQDSHSNLYLERAFKQLNHSVTQFDYRNTNLNPTVALTNDHLKELSQVHDLTLILKGEVFTPETLRSVHPCVLFNFDLWYSQENWLHEQVKAVDHFLTPSKGVFQGDNVHYMVEAADLELHRPMPYDKEYAIDVCFIGTVADIPGRDEWLERVGKWCDDNKKVLKIFGSFPGKKSDKWHQGRRAGEPLKDGRADNLLAMNEDAMHNIIVSSSKVILDRQRNPEIEGAVSARVFRVLAAKGFLLMRHCEGQEDLLGLKNGVNCATYRDDEECLAQISYYLSMPHKRMEIAERGYADCLSKHTWKHRVESILTLVKK